MLTRDLGFEEMRRCIHKMFALVTYDGHRMVDRMCRIISISNDYLESNLHYRED